jgi:hypothetical protein
MPFSRASPCPTWACRRSLKIRLSGKIKGEMTTIDFPSSKMDKSAFSVKRTFDESDDKAYWLSRTPYERLYYMETLRRINYGDKATARLQRVLEVTQR